MASVQEYFHTLIILFIYVIMPGKPITLDRAGSPSHMTLRRNIMLSSAPDSATTQSSFQPIDMPLTIEQTTDSIHHWHWAKSQLFLCSSHSASE